MLSLELLQIYTDSTELGRRHEVLRRIAQGIMVRASDRDDHDDDTPFTPRPTPGHSALLLA
jgi:hypothetical protein